MKDRKVSAAQQVQRRQGVLGDEFGDRERLGETVSGWITAHPHFEVVDMSVTQSSDASFHGVANTLFYFEQLAARTR
jgi:hypothetical protein